MSIRRQSLELSKKSKRFHIYEGQTVDLVELREQNELIKDELLEWKEKKNDLESEIKNKLHQETQVAIQEKYGAIKNLQTISEDLSSYLSSLENLAFKGKDISKVAKKSRTLKTFFSRAQSALWFATSFGLELKSLTVRETKSGELHHHHHNHHHHHQNKRTTLTSGAVDTFISDHSLVYTVLRSSAPRLRSRKIFSRSLKTFSNQILCGYANGSF